MPTNLADRAIKLVAKTNKMEKNIKFVALLKVLRESSLKETDRKLLFLEISMCRNCSSVEYLKCANSISTIGFGSLNPIPVVEHFRRSHP